MATRKDKTMEQAEQTTGSATTVAPAAGDPVDDAEAKAKAIIDEAEEKAAKIVSDAEAKAAEVAAKTTMVGNSADAESAVDPNEELVDYFAPVILGKTDQTIFCQVNGENIRIKRGVRVKIKRKFKLVLEQSDEQQMAAYAYMEEAQKGSSKALADLG